MLIRKRKTTIWRSTKRFTQVTAKAKAVVAKTLAEVTAKVGAAAEGLVEREMEMRENFRFERTRF